MAPRTDKKVPRYQRERLLQKVYFPSREDRAVFIKAARIAQGKTGRKRGPRDDANFSEFAAEQLKKISETIIAADNERKSLAAERQLGEVNL